MVNNLSQLKKAIAENKEFKIVAHCRAENVGQIRRPTITQTNGFYSIMPSDMESNVSKANDERGMWLKYGKAAYWAFEDGICTYRINKEHSKGALVLSFVFCE